MKVLFVSLYNVKIRKNSIVGALSFVTKDVLAGTVFEGVPAKKINSVEEMIRRDIKEFDMGSWENECF